MMADKYAGLSKDVFDGILEGIIDGMNAEGLLQLPGVYEPLSEALNNDVLSAWDVKQEEETEPKQQIMQCENCGCKGRPCEEVPLHGYSRWLCKACYRNAVSSGEVV